jgi:hypothetical protein
MMKTKDNGAALALAAVAALALGGLVRARQSSAPRGAPEGSKAKPTDGKGAPRRARLKPSGPPSAVIVEAEALVALVDEVQPGALARYSRSDGVRLPDVIVEDLQSRGADSVIGSGSSRIVFRSKVDPELVIKVDFDQGWANRNEADTYLNAGPKTRKILVPVVGSDPDGSWLIMKRVALSKDYGDVLRFKNRANRLFPRSPFYDLHEGNISSDVRLLDYGDVPPDHLVGSPSRISPDRAQRV